MKQKSGPDKVPAEQVLKSIRRQTRRQYKKRSALFWKDCAARRISPSFAAAKTSPPRCITAGPRSFLSRQALVGGGHGPRRDIRRGEGPSS